MELFKYAKRVHLLTALEHGSIRLGTLFDYRNTDDHGTQIGDENEGRIVMGGTLENVTHKTTCEHPVLERLIKLDSSSSIGKLSIKKYIIESENLFVFSTSRVFSEDAMLQWHEDLHARYDSCYRILSARLFFRAISTKLKGKAEFLGFYPVQYYNSSQPIHLASSLGRMHPGILKGGTTYEHQTEIRAFWRPFSADPIEPITIEIPELCKYLTHEFTLATTTE